MNVSLQRTMVALAATALLAFAPGIARAQATQSSDKVSGLLKDAKTAAYQLKTDSQELSSYSKTSITWHSHTVQVKKIKDDVNKIGSIMADLNSAKTTAAPWQKDAIDRITPLLQELAKNVEATIDHLNDTSAQVKLNTPAYHQYVKTNADLATDASNLISDFVAYDQTKAQFEELTNKLEPRN